MIKRLLLVIALASVSLSCSAENTPAANTGSHEGHAHGTQSVKSPPASAEQNAPAANYVAGTHYDVLPVPVRTADPATIEVAEFFWYGCSHCYTFEPLVQAWKKEMPEDVSFRGIPAVWRTDMELHARAYYTAEVLGVLDTVHPALFNAMNVDRKRLSSEKEIGALFAANGVSEEDFTKTFSSFGVASQVRQAVAQAKTAKVSGTPALLVDGKYHISSRKAGNHSQMLKLTDFLIANERKERAAQKAK